MDTLFYMHKKGDYKIHAQVNLLDIHESKYCFFYYIKKHLNISWKNVDISLKQYDIF